MGLSNDVPCRLARFTFTVLMGWAWSGGASPARAQSIPANPRRHTPQERAEAAQKIEKSLKAIEDADRENPRESFDLQAVLQKTGPDPLKVFEWVRDQTVWVPYRGALRQEIGVLMDRL